MEKVRGANYANEYRHGDPCLNIVLDRHGSAVALGRFGLKPSLDKAPDGFGAGREIRLFAAPCVDLDHLRRRDDKVQSGSLQFALHDANIHECITYARYCLTGPKSYVSY